MTTNSEWDAALKTYHGRRALLDLDSQLGEISERRRRYEISPRDAAAMAAFNDAQEAQRTRFQKPLAEAVAALIKTPAPDLGAVLIKRRAVGRLAGSHPEFLADAFALIAADIERLTGVSLVPADNTAA